MTHDAKRIKPLRSERHYALDRAFAPDKHPPFEQKMALHYAACQTGPCDQGRRDCITPEACRLGEEHVQARMPRAWLVTVLVVVLTLAAAWWLA